MTKTLHNILPDRVYVLGELRRGGFKRCGVCSFTELRPDVSDTVPGVFLKFGVSFDRPVAKTGCFISMLLRCEMKFATFLTFAKASSYFIVSSFYNRPGSKCSLDGVTISMRCTFSIGHLSCTQVTERRIVLFI